jgi:hypothetical protein
MDKVGYVKASYLTRHGYTLDKNINATSTNVKDFSKFQFIEGT